MFSANRKGKSKLGSVSVIVIAKNEEANIRDCLESVRWAHEIVVVDGGSTDKTVSIAKRFTRKVFVREWAGYGAAKNFGLKHCTKDWVFSLDADERATPELADEILASVNSGNTMVVGYEVSRRAYFLGKWIQHCGWYPGYVIRVFRRKQGKFSQEKVHEALLIQGQIVRLNHDLIHYTDPNLLHYFEKFNLYTSLAAEDLAQQKRRFKVLELLYRPLWTFTKMYFLRAGFRDGIQGFILCTLSSCYVFTKYAKLWELTDNVTSAGNKKGGR